VSRWLLNSNYPAFRPLALSTAPASAPLTAPGLWLTGAERAVLLVGLSIALGGLAGRGLARQYLAREDTPDAPAPLPAPWALRGSLVGAAASAALLVTALAGPDVAASLARPPAPGLGSRATGVIAAAELVCFALAAILLRLRQPGWSVLPLVGVVLAEAIRAHPEGMLPVAGAGLTCCHLLPAVMWAGMLVYTARTAIAWRAYPQSARDLLRVYGTAAAWLFAVVVVTGLFSALLLVPVRSLLTTTYGRFLIAKAALVAVTATLALAGRARLRRPAKPGVGLPLATRLEIAALAAVLAATGLLTVLTPPAKPVFPSAARPAAQPARYCGHHPATVSCAGTSSPTIGINVREKDRQRVLAHRPRSQPRHIVQDPEMLLHLALGAVGIPGAQAGEQPLA
jgi:copper transport protein